LFNAKADEIINIFKEGTSSEKSTAIEVMNLVDPSNANKYARIMEQK
jgi:hypothetical protein